MTAGITRAVLAAVLAGTMMMMGPSPAAATGTIDCHGVEDEAITAFLSVGRVPGLALLNGRFEAGDAFYATDAERFDGAVAITYGQGYADDDSVRADFLDLNALEIIVSLRLERAFEGTAFAEAGVLWVKGKGAWAVICESG